MQVMNIIKINDNSNKLFYIGGVVRDEILGKESFDIDITYVGNAIDYCSKFGEVIQENPDFGTMKVEVRKAGRQEGKLFNNSNICEISKEPQTDISSTSCPPDLHSSIIDFASTRSESYPKKGHLPVVEKIGCSLKEDVMRRDFTINALAKSVTTGEIVDYVGGLEDIKNKKLRVLHDESFIDDPTRIIRGLKFSVRFGFELEEHTKKLQDEYLNNINYDMSYKRVKKELIETFCLNSQIAFEKFINEKIYKLVTPNEVKLPKINIEKLINNYSTLQPFNHSTYKWLVYIGVLGDLSRLPLTKTEQKILDDTPKTKLKTDFEIYKAFENARIETVLLYAILYDEKAARRYLDNLRNIKIQITGKDLQNLGIKPSPKYQEIFDEVLKEKFKNPDMPKSEEINYLKKLKNEL